MTDPATEDVTQDIIHEGASVIGSSSVKKIHTIPPNLKEFYAHHGIDVDRLVATADNGTKNDEKDDVMAFRFVRLNPRFDRQETLDILKIELKAFQDYNDSISTENVELTPVTWLDDKLGFFMLPGTFRLVQSGCYQTGRIYGMDISSGAAVGALLTDRYDKKSEGTNNDNDRKKQPSEEQPFRVLDLCCAPGLKLCAMADYLAATPQGKSAEVVGVDVSEHRIALCKKILHKYHVHPETSGQNQQEMTASSTPCGGNVQMRLYCGDGTQFDKPFLTDNNPSTLVFDSNAASQDITSKCGKRKRMNKSARARERKRLSELQRVDYEPVKDDEVIAASTSTGGKPIQPTSSESWKAKLYDCVLVDAECSTDGSLKHIQKQINKPNTASGHDVVVAAKLVDEQQLADLVELQKQLAATGFRLLKPNGIMVYSTCSLSRDQNEHVVEWLLKEFSNTAHIVPLDFASDMEETIHRPHITHNEWGVRFHPTLPPEDVGGDPNKSAAAFCGGFFLCKIGKREERLDEIF